MKSNDNKEKNTTAFKKVDALFEDATTKDTAPNKEPDVKKADAKAVESKESAAKDFAEKVVDELALAPTEALHGFPDHPYTVDENDNDMARLVDSIQNEGLLERIVVQRRKEGGFEILSGHRRHRACQILGLKEVPVIIKHGLTKDQAVLLMVDANLKRENILPMDEAKALKMQMDAMNRMGKRSQHGKLKRTDEQIAERINKNRMYVQRKVKLLDLTPDLQNAVNEKLLSETPAYELASLPPKVQALFYDWMTLEDRAPTVAQALSLRQHQQELTKTGGADKKKGRMLTADEIDRVMNGERLASVFPPPEPEKVEQPEKGGAAQPQAPIDSPEKEEVDGSAEKDVPVPPVPQEGNFAEATAPSGAEPKAIPVQHPGTTPSQPGRTSYNSSAPAPEPPVSAADATKSYIRTEYMAELQRENVILPKSEVQKNLPGCSTNDEYVAAIKAALVAGQAKNVLAKAVDSKSGPAKPLLSEKPAEPPKASPQTAEIINWAEAKIDAEKAAGKYVEPLKADKPPVAQLPKPKDTEQPKVEKPSVVSAPKAPKSTKDDKALVTPVPQAVEKATATPGMAEPTKKDEGTKALDDFLKNKSRPGKGKGPQDKTPQKPR